MPPYLFKGDVWRKPKHLVSRQDSILGYALQGPGKAGKPPTRSPFLNSQTSLPTFSMIPDTSPPELCGI
jgi:hypothetical protein